MKARLAQDVWYMHDEVKYETGRILTAAEADEYKPFKLASKGDPLTIENWDGEDVYVYDFGTFFGDDIGSWVELYE